MRAFSAPPPPHPTSQQLEPPTANALCPLTLSRCKKDWLSMKKMLYKSLIRDHKVSASPWEADKSCTPTSSVYLPFMIYKSAESAVIVAPSQVWV